MSKTFRVYEPEQMLLLPVALQEWLPPDHLAHFVSEVVDQLDLSAITDRYVGEERGYPPYHPRMMVKLGHVSLDSTKIKANASKHKAMSYGRMKREEARLEEEIKELLRRAQQEDEAEDRRYGAGRRGDELPQELAFRESRLWCPAFKQERARLPDGMNWLTRIWDRLDFSPGLQGPRIHCGYFESITHETACAFALHAENFSWW